MRNHQRSLIRMTVMHITCSRTVPRVAWGSAIECTAVPTSCPNSSRCRGRCLIRCGGTVDARRVAAQISSSYAVQSSPSLLSDTTMDSYHHDSFPPLDPSYYHEPGFLNSSTTNLDQQRSPIGNRNVIAPPSGSAASPQSMLHVWRQRQ